jgi:hypothetical protein
MIRTGCSARCFFSSLESAACDPRRSSRAAEAECGGAAEVAASSSSVLSASIGPGSGDVDGAIAR